MRRKNPKRKASARRIKAAARARPVRGKSSLERVQHPRGRLGYSLAER
jgi:hypothetical protein